MYPPSAAAGGGDRLRPYPKSSRFGSVFRLEQAGGNRGIGERYGSVIVNLGSFAKKEKMLAGRKRRFADRLFSIRTSAFFDRKGGFVGFGEQIGAVRRGGGARSGKGFRGSLWRPIL